jgi:hypothetical protein
MVKENNGQSVYIKPVSEQQNSFRDSALSKLLEQNNLSPSVKNYQIAESLMNHNMPVDRGSMQKIMQQSYKFPDAPIDNIVNMNKLGIPVNESTLNQYQDMLSNNHQLAGNISDFAKAVSDFTGEQAAGLENNNIDAETFKQNIDTILKTVSDENDMPADVFKGENSEVSQQTGQNPNIIKGEAVPEYQNQANNVNKEGSNTSAPETGVKINAERYDNINQQGETTQRFETGTQINEGKLNLQGNVTESVNTGKQGDLNLKGSAESGVDSQVSAGNRPETLQHNDNAGRQAETVQQSNAGGRQVETVQQDNAGRQAETVQQDNTARQSNLGSRGEITRQDNFTQPSGVQENTLQGSDANGIAQSISHKLSLDESSVENILNKLQEAGVSDDRLKLLNDKSETPLQLVNNINELLKSIPDNSDGKLAAEIMKSKEFQTVFSSAVNKKFSIDAEKTDNPKELSDLYKSIYEKAEKLMNSFQNDTGAAGEQMRDSGKSMQERIDFVQNLNELFSYAQIPFNISGNETNSELFVYMNKGKKLDVSKEVSALLHLDMEHLGATDVHVSLSGNVVHTRFYVDDEESANIIDQHMTMLEKAMNDTGYSLTNEVVARNTGETSTGNKVVDELLGKDLEQSIKRYSFDVKM